METAKYIKIPGYGRKMRLLCHKIEDWAPSPVSIQAKKSAASKTHFALRQRYTKFDRQFSHQVLPPEPFGSSGHFMN